MRRIDTLIVYSVGALLVVGIVLFTWLVYNDPIGHLLLCDVPGSKVCK